MQRLKRYFMFYVVAALVAGCGLVPVSPERQIRDGSNTVTAGATVTSSLLRVDKITKAQASSYLAVLKTAGGHLNVAFATLEECRKRTGSNEDTTPDPCRPSVQADINLGVSVAAEVKKALDTK